jgi:hypothetical protein
MFSSQSSGPVNAAINTVTNVATGVAAGTVEAANNVFQSVNTAANNFSKNLPALNDLIPLSSNTSSSSGASNNSWFSSNYNEKPSNNSNTKLNNKPSNMNKGNSSFNNSSLVNTGKSSWLNPLYIFIGIVIVFVALFSVFNRQIVQGYEYTVSSIKTALGYPADPDVTAAVEPVMPVAPVTVAPEAPQDVTPKEHAIPERHSKTFVERVLPSSGNEVFNVAKNDFTYYDAEPLCNALGAELATYEQVKEAWGQGADWCNYGWVKGQMAVYPTQKETYSKLQAGPADQRNACGTVGINGGYFDNPEFRYGVNCYGKKPNQSAHDQQLLMSQGKVPKSPETLKIDQLVNEFKGQVDSLFVKPFSDEKWSTT